MTNYISLYQQNRINPNQLTIITVIVISIKLCCIAPCLTSTSAEPSNILDHRSIEEFIIDGRSPSAVKIESNQVSPSRSKYDYGVYSESGDWTRKKIKQAEQISGAMRDNINKSIQDNKHSSNLMFSILKPLSIKELFNGSDKIQHQQSDSVEPPRRKDYETTISAYSLHNMNISKDIYKTQSIPKKANQNQTSPHNLIEARAEQIGGDSSESVVNNNNNSLIRNNRPHKRAVYRGRYYLDQFQRDYDKQRLQFSRTNAKRYLPFYEYRYLTRYNYEDPINYQLKQQLGSLGSNFWLDRYHYNWYRHRQPNYYLDLPSRWPKWIESQRALNLAPPLAPSLASAPVNSAVDSSKYLNFNKHQDTIDSKNEYSEDGLGITRKQTADKHFNHDQEKSTELSTRNHLGELGHPRTSNYNVQQQTEAYQTQNTRPNTATVDDYSSGNKISNGVEQDKNINYNANITSKSWSENSNNNVNLSEDTRRTDPNTSITRELYSSSKLAVPSPPADINYQSEYRRLNGESISEYSNRIERLNNYYRWIRNRAALSPAELAALDYGPGRSSSFRLGDSEVGIGYGANPLRSRQVWLDNESPTIAASLAKFPDAQYNPDYNPYDSRYPPNDIYGLLPRDYWPHHDRSIEFNHRASAYSNSNRGYSESLSANTTTLPALSAYDNYLRCKDTIPRSRLWYIYNCS